jgi:hypothetical protein
MPSKDTIAFHMTKPTRQELDIIKSNVSKINKVPMKDITLKHCEIIMREKSKAGFISTEKVMEILVGKIR